MPDIDHNLPTTVIFGCGYIGSRLARALLAEGRPVRACSRHLDRLAPLAALGAELHPVDAHKGKQFGPALRGTIQASVVYCIPPPFGLPGGDAVRRAAQASLAAGVRSFVYLGTAGLYGNTPDDEWVDEDTAIDLTDVDMSPRHQDESAIQSATLSGLRTCTLRMGVVYGPGKGVRKRLREGQYRLVDDGQHYVSRIHIDDAVAVIRAAGERAQQGSMYLVADDQPTTQREYAEWLCQRLDLPLPGSVASLAPGMKRTYLRGRRLRNERMKRDLRVQLRYPTYVEGELQIEAEEAGMAEAAAPLAPPRAEAVQPRAAAPSATLDVPATTPVAVAVAPERPPFVSHIMSLPSDGGRRFPGGQETHAVNTALSRPVGLARLDVSHGLLLPGRRTSWPHAHLEREEMLYVLEGQPDLWIDGELHRLAAGDVVGLQPGTGVAHTLINNTRAPVRFLFIAEGDRPGDRVAFPLDPEGEKLLPEERRWADAPRHPLGPASPLPDGARR